MSTLSFGAWYRRRLGHVPVWGQVGLWVVYGFLWIPLWYFSTRNRSGAMQQCDPSQAGARQLPQARGSTGRAFSWVVVAGAQTFASPLYDQLERKLVERVAANPRFPLTPDVTVTTVRGPSLPEERREALEPFVWSLQRKYGRDTGGRWQADFYEELGMSFVVIYLP